MRLRRSFIGLFIVFFSITNISTSYAETTIQVSAENAILIEQSTGDVLFEKKAHDRREIASITKIMTAIIAIESGQLDEKATASRRAVYTEGSSIYLEQGEKMSVEDLLYGLMLRSGNDAAVTLAEHIGESVEGFVHLMNEKAKWLGMDNTHFTNPHGLNAEEHYSTAYDMAILMKYAMDNPEFRKVSGTTSYKADTRTYEWQNKNKLLTTMYEYSTGGKTGFTKAAGRTLVSSAAKDDTQLIVVTLNAPDDWTDHMTLFEWGFEKYKEQTSEDEDNVSMQIAKTNQKANQSSHEDMPVQEKKTENHFIDYIMFVYEKILRIEPND